jgi:sec-independent protein translocase protein TatA
MRFGPTEILLILGLVVFFFGGRKLPELARGLGSGIRNFKGELRQPPGGESDDHDDESR